MLSLCVLVKTNMSAQDLLRGLKADLRALRRSSRTWAPGRAAILEPTTEVKLTTVIICSLCQDAAFWPASGLNDDKTGAVDMMAYGRV